MANFPDEPHTIGDTVEMGDVTYKWNGQAWQVDVDTRTGGILSCQSGPPTNPNVGDRWYDTDINILYTRIKWKSLNDNDYETWIDLSTAGGGGGGGSSEWTDNSGVLHPETHATETVAIGTDTGDANAKLTIDGAESLKGQASAPTDTVGYAKIYAKNRTGTDPAAMLLHFNDDLTDKGSAGVTLSAPGTANYANDTGVSHFADGKFGKAIKMDTNDGARLDWYQTTGHADTTFTGEFTYDFWVKMNPWSSGSDSGGTGVARVIGNNSWDYSSDTGSASIFMGVQLLYLNKINSSTSHRNQYVLRLPISSGAIKYGYFQAPGTDAASDTLMESWNHIAIVRYSTSSNDWKVFFNGTEMTKDYSGGTLQGNSTSTVDPDNKGILLGTYRPALVDSNNNTWTVNTANPSNLDGYIDEFRITGDSSLFPSSGFTLPTRSYVSANEAETDLYVKTALGHEVKLT